MLQHVLYYKPLSQPIDKQLMFSFDILYLYLYLRGRQHAVKRRGRNQFRPNVQPRDKQKVM